MGPATILRITDKGMDEVKHRTCKLGLKFRGVLLLLGKPQTLQYALHQSAAFPAEEMRAVIAQLAQEGFIVLEEAPSAPTSPVSMPPAAPTVSVSATATQTKTPQAENTWHLDDEIILSEGKFLLVDFCVDCFGMQSQAVVDDIHACKSVAMLRALLDDIIGLVNKNKPDQLPALHATVQKINETA